MSADFRSTFQGRLLFIVPKSSFGGDKIRISVFFPTSSFGEHKFWLPKEDLEGRTNLSDCVIENMVRAIDNKKGNVVGVSIDKIES